MLIDPRYIPLPSRVIRLPFAPLGFKLARNGDMVLADYEGDTVVTLGKDGKEKTRLKSKLLGMEGLKEWTTSPWDVLIDDNRDQFIVSDKRFKMHAILGSSVLS